MKGYLVCSLDDENYSEPTLYLYREMNRAKEQCVNEVAKTWEISVDEAKSVMSFFQNGDSYQFNAKENDCFLVNEIIPVEFNENDAFCVSYHAYDGVDFHVEKIGTVAECETALKMAVLDCIHEKNAFVEWKCEKMAVIDAADEWIVVTIVAAKDIEGDCLL